MIKGATPSNCGCKNDVRTIRDCNPQLGDVHTIPVTDIKLQFNLLLSIKLFCSECIISRFLGILFISPRVSLPKPPTLSVKPN